MCASAMNYTFTCLAILTVFSHTEVSRSVLLKHNLVLAEVTKIEPFDVAGYRASFSITRVYKGNADLLRREFTIETNMYGDSNQGLAAFTPPLKVGDVVIWYLRDKGKTLEYLPEGIRMKALGPMGLIYSSVRRGGGDMSGRPFEEVEGWAKSVEVVAAAAPEARYALLKTFAQSRSPLVAKWAMAVVAEVNPSDAGTFLRQLIDRNDLGVLQRLSADGILAKIEPSEWRCSPDRLHLYEQWVRESLPRDASDSLHGSLDEMLHARDVPFPVEALLQLHRTANATRTKAWGEIKGGDKKKEGVGIKGGCEIKGTGAYIDECD